MAVVVIARNSDDANGLHSSVNIGSDRHRLFGFDLIRSTVFRGFVFRYKAPFDLGGKWFFGDPDVIAIYRRRLLSNLTKHLKSLVILISL